MGTDLKYVSSRNLKNGGGELGIELINKINIILEKKTNGVF